MNGKLLPHKYAALNLHPANSPPTPHDVLTSWYVLLTFYGSMHSLAWPNPTLFSPSLTDGMISSSQQSAGTEHFTVHTRWVS